MYACVIFGTCWFSGEAPSCLHQPLDRVLSWPLHMSSNAKLVRWIVGQLGAQYDAEDELENKMLVFWALAIVGVCGIIWGSLYLHLKWFVLAIFPFLFSALAVYTDVHFLMFKRVRFPRITGGGGNSAGGFFRGENSVFQFGAEFSPHFSRGGAEFSPCGILSM